MVPFPVTKSHGTKSPGNRPPQSSLDSDSVSPDHFFHPTKFTKSRRSDSVSFSVLIGCRRQIHGEDPEPVMTLFSAADCSVQSVVRRADQCSFLWGGKQPSWTSRHQRRSPDQVFAATLVPPGAVVDAACCHDRGTACGMDRKTQSK